MSEDSFAPSRLTVARRRRGWTKKALGEKANISGPAISGFETGTRSPSPETLRRIAGELGFPIEFFYAEPLYLDSTGLESFRALRSMSAAVRSRVEGTKDIVSHVISPYLHSKFRLPEPQIPDFGDTPVNPSIAAEEVRHVWKLGQQPLSNLVHVLESNGVHIYWISDPTLAMDAFSFWRDGRPYIIANANRPGERQRMSMAHEGGHLALRHDIVAGWREIEDEAFEFASSLLLPEAQFRESFWSARETGELFFAAFALKQEWRVSVAAIIYRCKSLGLIGEDEYSNAFRELSVQGWRRTEPRPLPAEESLLHEKVFEKLGEDGITPPHMARDLHLPLADLLELMPVSRRFLQAEDQVTLGRFRPVLLD